MKKIITLLLITTAAILNVNATGTDPVNRLVKHSFSKEFSNIKDVNWTWIQEQNLYKATFDFNSKALNAYFTKDGEYVGSSRFISREQLPVLVLKQLEDRYTDYQLRTLIEFSSSNITSYFVTIEGEKRGYVLKASTNGELVVVQKIKKPN